MLIKRVSGFEGRLRWGYRTAATLGPWQYEAATGNTGTLTAQVVDRDEFCLQQAPLVAIVPMGRAEWRWSVSGLQIEGATLTASVSPEA